MTSVAFSQAVVRTSGHPISVYEAILQYSSYGGAFVVQPKVNAAADLSAGQWVGLGATWSILGKTITGTWQGAEATAYSDSLVNDPITMPHSFIIEVNASAASGSVLFKVNKDNTEHLRFQWDNSSIKIVYLQLTGQEKTIVSLPHGLQVGVVLKIMVREYQYSMETQDKWILMGVWADGEYLISGALQIADYRFGDGIGFRISGSGQISWERPSVAIMTIPIDWATLDPNETPFTAMSRSIGERHLSITSRFDGSISVSRYEQMNTDLVIGRYNNTRTSILFNEPNYARVWGGGILSADVIDAESVNNGIMRFTEVSNPNLFTEREAYDEALLVFIKSAENRIKRTILVNYCPLLEVDDIIDINGEKYVVEAIDVSREKSKAKATISARIYSR